VERRVLEEVMVKVVKCVRRHKSTDSSSQKKKKNRNRINLKKCMPRHIIIPKNKNKKIPEATRDMVVGGIPIQRTADCI
jgi:hypothetical protein